MYENLWEVTDKEIRKAREENYKLQGTEEWMKCFGQSIIDAMRERVRENGITIREVMPGRWEAQQGEQSAWAGTPLGALYLLIKESAPLGPIDELVIGEYLND